MVLTPVRSYLKRVFNFKFQNLLRIINDHWSDLARCAVLWRFDITSWPLIGESNHLRNILFRWSNWGKFSISLRSFNSHLNQERPCLSTGIRSAINSRVRKGMVAWVVLFSPPFSLRFFKKIFTEQICRKKFGTTFKIVRECGSEKI